MLTNYFSLVSRALQLSKEPNVLQVPFYISAPKELKTKFQAYCEKNKVDMSSMLVSFMAIACDSVDDGCDEADND